MDKSIKSIIELADECQRLVASLEAKIKVAHAAAEKEHADANRRADKADEDESVDLKILADLVDAEAIAGKNDDHLTAAHSEILTALNSIIDAGVRLRAVK